MSKTDKIIETVKNIFELMTELAIRAATIILPFAALAVVNILHTVLNRPELAECPEIKNLLGVAMILIGFIVVLIILVGMYAITSLENKEQEDD